MDARFSDKPAINTHTALTGVALHVYVRSGLFILFQMIGNVLKILFLLYTLISSIESTGQGTLIKKPQKTVKWVCFACFFFLHVSLLYKLKICVT